MIRNLLLALALSVVSFPAFGQNGSALCEFLPVKEHFVSADYVPGVDVHGNAVVPADVKAKSEALVDVIRIPVTVDLAEDLGADIGLPENAEMDAQLSMVEIRKDSKIVINGKDMTNEVYAYCGKEPFDIHSASVEPEVQKPIMTPIVPDKKPVKEEIIWGEDY